MRDAFQNPFAGLENTIIKADLEEIYARGYEWNQFEGKSVLITGAYGMLASYMAYFLLYLREYKKIEIEIFLQGRNEEKARMRFGDYLDKEYVHYIKDDILSESGGEIPPTDYIVHAAGIANPRFYTTNPVEVIEPNVIGTYRLLRNCAGRNIQSFLLFSTGDIYGKVTDTQNITEETLGLMDPLDGHSCYGESKRLAETLCSAFYREYGIRTVIARIGHTYAPTMDVENDPRVFASFMKSAVYEEDIVLHSDGLAKRPFCYITDATAAFFLLMLRGAGGEAYNVTNTDQMISIRDIAQVIGNIPDKTIEIKYKEREVGDTYQVNTLNDENKPVEWKLRDLGWEHPIDVMQGFKRVYRYFIEQKER